MRGCVNGHVREEVQKEQHELLKKKFLRWAVSFARLDPRVRLHRFFQGIAKTGELRQNLMRQSSKRRLSLIRQNRERTLLRDPSQHESMANTLNSANVFTVWRPCSQESIRKMMRGEGVGKGLDIKGKSAKCGKCSAYVPFMQIHSESDKLKIDRLPADSKMKIFYKSKKTRDEAMKIASKVLIEMKEKVSSSDSLMTSTSARASIDTEDYESNRHSDTTFTLRTKSYDFGLIMIILSVLCLGIFYFFWSKSDRLRDSYWVQPTAVCIICMTIALAILLPIMFRNATERKTFTGMDSSDRTDATDINQNYTFRPVTVYKRREAYDRKNSFADTRERMMTGEDVMTYYEACEQKQSWYMVNPSVKPLNDYSNNKPSIFGMELPERLFWEAFVMRQNQHCERWNILRQSQRASGHCDACIKREGFAEKLIRQMVKVSSQQAVDKPVIIWIDEANLEGENRSAAPTKLTVNSFRESILMESFGKKSKDVPKKQTSSWSFVIIDKDRFVEHVLKPIQECDETFNSKYSSFLGELRRSGFEEQATGRGIARFRHPYFQKDRPELCALVGSEHYTGRESFPIYQNANFASLRKKNKDGPKVVLFSMDDNESPHCPHNLLMAYEELGRVVPVVSDFDGFIFGTKGISIRKPIPEDQIDVMKKTIQTSHEVLSGNAIGESWAEKWTYAGRDHFAVKSKCMPKFGYGDPMSSGMVAAAVQQMAKLDGAVRHGAESFNFEYPQEIDKSFLVISDAISETIPGTTKKTARWAEVDSAKLHYFLENRIKEGFTFPCNPKWILHDPGWAKLYEMLLTSKNPITEQAMEVWFPQKSGLREMIRRTQEAHPIGLSFRSLRASASRSGEKSKERAISLNIVATYSLKSSLSPLSLLKGHHQVKLMINRGSVVNFARPGLRAGIVCASNESCIPVCGGVLQAVVEAGGVQLLNDAYHLPVLTKTVFGKVRCNTGDAKIVAHGDGSNYGTLDVSHVVFAVGPAFGDDDLDLALSIKDELLRSAYRSSLERAKEHRLEAIAFSLLSAGKRSIATDAQRAIRIAVKCISDYRDFGFLREIHLCAFTAKEVDAIMSVAKEYSMEELD